MIVVNNDYSIGCTLMVLFTTNESIMVVQIHCSILDTVSLKIIQTGILTHLLPDGYSLIKSLQ